MSHTRASSNSGVTTIPKKLPIAELKIAAAYRKHIQRGSGREREGWRRRKGRERGEREGGMNNGKLHTAI